MIINLISCWKVLSREKSLLSVCASKTKENPWPFNLEGKKEMIYVRDLNGGFLTERKNIYICWVHEQDWVRLHLTHLRWKMSTWYIRAFLILLISWQENISIVTKRKYCHHCMHWIWSISDPALCFVCHASRMIHDGRGDIFLSALATQGFWSFKRTFVTEESFILHVT